MIEKTTAVKVQVVFEKTTAVKVQVAIVICLLGQKTGGGIHLLCWLRVSLSYRFTALSSRSSINESIMDGYFSLQKLMANSSSEG